MKSKLFCASVCAAMLLAGTLFAHHSPSAIFDMTKKAVITGTMTELNWVNPHIAVIVDVKKDGAVETWKFESNPPAWFRQVGVSRNDLAKGLGQTVTIEAVTAIDGSRYGYLNKITLPDGTVLELISEFAKQK